MTSRRRSLWGVRMKCPRLLSVLFFISIFSQQSFSADVLQIGQPTYSGTGCEAGTATLSLSPDRTQLSVLFNQFVVESGARLGRQIDRKGCVVNIPIRVPSGYTMAIATVDYRGFMNLPLKTRGQFVASSTFAGSERFREDRQFVGPFMEDFTFRSQATTSEKVWSQCGRQTVLRTQAVMVVNSGPSGADTLGSVDSVDVAAGISYRLELRRCQDVPVIPPPVPVDPYPRVGGLNPGSELAQYQGVRSNSGEYLLIHQGDGNVVIYNSQGQAIWSTQTQGLPSGRLVMQGDGNLVIYNTSGSAIWDSQTYNHPGARLALQDDGNLIIYDVDGTPIWWIRNPYPKTGGLASNTELRPGQGISSDLGQYTFVHQKDGNVVMYDAQNNPVWSTQTQGLPSGRLVMQGDGNLVIYNTSGDPIWDSQTYDHPGSRLAVQDDGNLVIYDSNGTPIWSIR